MIVRGDGPYPWSSFFIGSICLSRRIQLYGLRMSRVFRWWIPILIGWSGVLLPVSGARVDLVSALNVSRATRVC